jgi:hypothetical protein
VQDITEADAQAEGVTPECYEGMEHQDNPILSAKACRTSFCDLWDAINSKSGFGWDANPWVWVVEFRRLS